MKNSNILIAGVAIVIVGIGGFYAFTNSNTAQTPSAVADKNGQNTSADAANLTQPTSLATYNGYVTSIEGNELTLDNEIGRTEISDEERAKRQAMSQEERQALRAQEAEGLSKESVTLTIPVGVPITKGTGDGRGTNISAQLSEITKGTYLSIWEKDGSIEFVKVKGSAN